MHVIKYCLFLVFFIRSSLHSQLGSSFCFTSHQKGLFLLMNLLISNKQLYLLLKLMETNDKPSSYLADRQKVI
jgi:hypothetical protein